MAKTTNPLFSMTATGTLGGSITMLRQLGRNISKRHSKPGGAPSAAQLARRSRYAANASIWSSFNTDQKAIWNADAASFEITPFNAFLRSVMGRTITIKPVETGAINGATVTGAPTIWEAAADDNINSYISLVTNTPQVKFQNHPAPPAGSLHYLDVILSTQSGYASFALIQGTTEVCSLFMLGDAPTKPTRVTLVLTNAEIDSITDRSALSIRFQGLSGWYRVHTARMRIETPA